MAPHILIVDADRNAAEVTGALIQHIASDATLRYASTLRHGWIAAQCAVPDVLIVDPGPHTPASMLLIQMCKASWPPMQVVVLTLARTLTKQIQADVHIDKVVAAPALVDTLQTVIQQATRASRAAPFQQTERPSTSSNEAVAPWIDAQIGEQISCARSLSRATLDAVAAVAVLRRVERGVVITLEGGPADALYVFAQGHVRMVRYSREGREHILRVAAAGDLFNSVPVLDGGPCPATSIALEPTALLVLERAALLDLIDQYPDLARALLHEFAGRLRMFVDLVDGLALHTVHSRVATLLLQQEAASACGALRTPPMTQSEMAAHLGSPSPPIP